MENGLCCTVPKSMQRKFLSDFLKTDLLEKHRKRDSLTNITSTPRCKIQKLYQKGSGHASIYFCFDPLGSSTTVSWLKAKFLSDSLSPRVKGTRHMVPDTETSSNQILRKPGSSRPAWAPRDPVSDQINQPNIKKEKGANGRGKPENHSQAIRIIW